VGLLHRVLFPQLLLLKLDEGYSQNKGCSDIQMNIRCPPIVVANYLECFRVVSTCCKP
jgi:hypothetical protein